MHLVIVTFKWSDEDFNFSSSVNIGRYNPNKQKVFSISITFKNMNGS